MTSPRARLIAIVFLVAASCGERSVSTATPTPTPPTPPAPASTSTPDSPATSTPTSTPTPDSTPTSTSTPAPAPSPSAAALVRVVAAVEPSGRLALAPGAETVVDPAATFVVELGARVPDARLLLSDPQDAHVPATATSEVGDTTRVTLAPAAPLVPGSRYVLRLDGATTRELHDGSGRAYAPVSFPVLAAGTPPPPEPKKKPARRRR